MTMNWPVFISAVVSCAARPLPRSTPPVEVAMPPASNLMTAMRFFGPIAGATLEATADEDSAFGVDGVAVCA